MDTFTGTHGRAERIPEPKAPQGSEAVAAWLITSPQWAPHAPIGAIWTQWLIGCVRLREVPHLPPPGRHFDGATHEIHVFSIHPEGGPLTAAGFYSERVDFLQPQNVVVQFIATDAEMLEVTDLAAHAVVEGVYCPESWRWPGGNQSLTEAWRSGLTKTLAHVRGEVHAP